MQATFLTEIPFDAGGQQQVVLLGDTERTIIKSVSTVMNQPIRLVISAESDAS
ncbi:MAG: hypothetical protein IPQ00_03295 [Chloracidobacterium sp.]|nr:hypothetical protein [Chloracidobacterium sp.]